MVNVTLNLTAVYKMDRRRDMQEQRAKCKRLWQEMDKRAFGGVAMKIK